MGAHAARHSLQDVKWSVSSVWQPSANANLRGNLHTFRGFTARETTEGHEQAPRSDVDGGVSIRCKMEAVESARVQRLTSPRT